MLPALPELHRAAAAAARRYELGRQPAMTKLSSNVCVRRVRVRGGNSKFRALRLDHGNFSWGSEVRAVSAVEVSLQVFVRQSMHAMSMSGMHASGSKQWSGAEAGRGMQQGASMPAAEMAKPLAYCGSACQQPDRAWNARLGQHGSSSKWACSAHGAAMRLLARSIPAHSSRHALSP